METLIKTAPRVKPDASRYGLAMIVLLLGMLGIFLRLYLLRGQIPLNDEWHGPLYVTAHPLSYLLRHASFAATCPPLNAYQWILLHTVGWSELGLLLPSLLPGILALFIFPPMVKKMHGNFTGIAFALLLALSPLLTFYSRVDRPYSMLVFLVFLSVYSAGFWLLSNKKRYLWIHVLSGVSAVYFHPVAIVSIFAPLAIGGACSVFKTYLSRHFPVPQIRPSLPAIFLTGILLLVFSTTALMPSWGASTVVMGKNPLPTQEIWRQFALMLFGTSSSLMAVVLLCFGVNGAVILLRKNFFWGAVFVLLWFLHVLMIVVSRIFCVDVAIVLARFLIVLFPICFIWVGIAAEECFLFIQKNSRNPGKILLGGALLLVGALLLTSPLRETYKAPNNFTNHSAFQESYEFDGWQKPVRSRIFPDSSIGQLTDIPEFYRALPKKNQCLIEYPMLLGDYFNFYYYYQHFHKKRIVAGYTDAVHLTDKQKDCIFGSYFIDHVLGAVQDKSRLRFRNMVDIFDQGAVRKTGADYLVVHRNLMNEFFPGKPYSGTEQTPDIKNCTEKLRAQYGAPVYEDRQMLVFTLSGTKGSVAK